MELGLAGRATVVAGGTRGIGRSTAELLAAEGARVAVLARDELELRDTEEALQAAGARDALGLQCDLLDTGEVEAAFSFLDERWGECHALVNAVSPAHFGALDELTDNEWLDEFDRGVLTMVRTTRAALPLLRKATFARIVNLAASSIRHQSPGLIGYTAAEAALASASTCPMRRANALVRLPNGRAFRECCIRARYPKGPRGNALAVHCASPARFGEMTDG